MEHFTVRSDKEFSALEKYIDESDIFILILGDEYGSCDSKGTSWTEREYLYAKKKKKPRYILKTQKYVKLEKQYDLDKTSLSEEQKSAGLVCI